MNIVSSPPLSRVLALLESCDLPVNDLHQRHMNRFLALENDGHVCAVVGQEVFGSVGLLRSLAVAPEYRDLGCGQLLVSATEMQARKAGITDLYLLTETAEQFFTSLSWAVIDREHAPDAIKNSTSFTTLCPSHAVLMHHSLSLVAHASD